MSVVRFNARPFSSVFPSFVDDFFTDFLPVSTRDSNNGFGSVPPVNIEETDKEFKLSLAVPGMKKEDIKVEIENGSLCISAENEESSEEQEKNYTRKEYSYNSFKRTFTLPENATDKVSAKYEDGVLNIALPKKEVTVSKAKRIKVA